MKTLIVGYLGQLGTDLIKTFDGDTLLLQDKDTLSVEDAAHVSEYIAAERPELVLNCSAFHRVDDCEDDTQPPFSVNVFGVRNLALACRATGATLVHFSTDYVFDSERRAPYVETDLPCPKSVYGVSKAAGEIMLQSIWDKHFIFRVCGLYGYAGSREKGSNFVEMMISLARQGKPLKVVDDQILTPISTADVAAAVRRITTTNHYGLYHLTAEGQCSWYEFAQAIFEYAGLQPELSPVGSEAFPQKAKRPSYSVLDNQRLRQNGFPELAHWRDSLQRYINGRAANGRT